MTKTTGIGKALPKNFKKQQRGYDQAFTLPKGTSAAPIMQAQAKPPKLKIKLSKTDDAFLAGSAAGVIVTSEINKSKNEKKNKFFGHTSHINKKRK